MVYVLEIGCYESRGVSGIFLTPEAAMAFRKTRKKQTWTHHEKGRFAHEPEHWTNNLDWDDAAEVWPTEVQT